MGKVDIQHVDGMASPNLIGDIRSCPDRYWDRDVARTFATRGERGQRL